jgi:riboflavin kinase/FMN adenylyltransferase
MTTEKKQKIKLVLRKDFMCRSPMTSVMALGTFDGVHIAHRALISEAVKLKKKLGADSVGVWCFEESPASVLRGEVGMTLTEEDEKTSLLLKCGADFVSVARFEDFRDMSAVDFVLDVLIYHFGCVGAVCGYDHRFGRGGLGDPLLLKKIFGSNRTVTVQKITLGGETVSSSAIRAHLRRGEVEKANMMLGRALSFTATVQSGKRLGRTIGFPTANQTLPRGLNQLRFGVYATRCSFSDGEKYIGVSNVGVRPSIGEGDDHRVNCETYLIDFSGEVYGREMTVEFCAFLREEMKFSSLDELKSAIEKDKNKTVEFFRGR